MERLIPGVVVFLGGIPDCQFIFSDDWKKSYTNGDAGAYMGRRAASLKILSFSSSVQDLSAAVAMGNSEMINKVNFFIVIGIAYF